MLPECGAETKSTKKPCGRPAGWGTGHPGIGKCKLHGGASPQAELAGVVTLARADALANGTPMSVEPHDAILQCIQITAGEVRYASDQISELNPRDYIRLVVSSKERPLDLGKDGESETQRVKERTEGPPALNVWIEVRQRAMDRLVKFSEIALRAGVEERMVRSAERYGESMAQLLREVLGDLGVPLDDPRTREVVTRHLRLLDGGRVA